MKVDLVDNRKGRKNGPNEQDKCFKCNKGGHWYINLVYILRARNCPNKTSPRRSRKRSNSRSKYFKLFKLGGVIEDLDLDHTLQIHHLVEEDIKIEEINIAEVQEEI